MAKTKVDKYDSKKQQLIERTAAALNIETSEAEALLTIGRNQSIRVNTLTSSMENLNDMFTQSDVQLEAFPWIDHGYFIQTGVSVVKKSEASTLGAIYVQNAASWLPVLALNPQPGDAILDMCAAPGGKTSHIAQLSGNAASITANDNSRPRLHKLQANLARMGAENVEFLLHDATKLSYKLGTEQFDKILLDAPCSGEGMMTLDSRKDFESWSVAHIKRLQQLQKKLIVQAWQLLKPGGTLVYSTCTMAPEENEAVLDYLLRHNDDIEMIPLDSFKAALDNNVTPVSSWNGKQYDSRVNHSMRLQPSQQVEAFFVVALQKTR